MKSAVSGAQTPARRAARLLDPDLMSLALALYEAQASRCAPYRLPFNLHIVGGGNPYRLARDIRGIGFKTADAIAMRLGIEKTAMIRMRAGIGYALTEAMDEGHCGLPTEERVPLAEELLEVEGSIVETALKLELGEGVVIANTVGKTPCIFLAGLHRADRVIAKPLMRLADSKLP